MPEPTIEAIQAAFAEEPAELVIFPDKANKLTVHVGRRVRIRRAPGETRELKIAFTGAVPFIDESPDPNRRRSTGDEFRTTVRGKSFLFNCFLDGERITTPGYAGEIEVGPE